MKTRFCFFPLHLRKRGRRRNLRLLGALLVWGFLSCAVDLDESFAVVFPRSPLEEVLGEPHWRLEWYDPAGELRQTELDGRGRIEIRVMYQWPSPVTARPYWPERGIAPGICHPAGALYPFDVSGGKISLSWRGGVEAHFYHELSLARSLPGADPRRAPQYFDWQRFRSLLWEEAVEKLEEDPWLGDWKGMAEKTVLSGFRKSLIKVQSRIPVEVEIPCGGPWFSASPFRPAEPWVGGQRLVLNLPPGPEVYLCPQGVLRISPEIRLWRPF